MKRNIYKVIAIITLIMSLFTSKSFSQTDTDISLPSPDRTGGRPLMACLNDRQSSREFSTKELSMQDISNLLWAANGINREKESKHTAPTSMNSQNMEVYIILKDGVYQYDDKANKLKMIQPGNHMKAAGKQDFVEKAMLNVIIVSDMTKLGDASLESKLLNSGIHAGAIIQNIYLYCASAGLHTVVRAWFDQDTLSQALKLSSDKRVILAQTVGY
ncbi:MAG: nitroreductase family protein [Omnitrophica WOR_2 bacterium]|jgi:SagB-type dehydrogenase family enzyme